MRQKTRDLGPRMTGINSAPHVVVPSKPQFVCRKNGPIIMPSDGRCIHRAYKTLTPVPSMQRYNYYVTHSFLTAGAWSRSQGSRSVFFGLAEPGSTSAMLAAGVQAGTKTGKMRLQCAPSPCSQGGWTPFWGSHPADGGVISLYIRQAAHRSWLRQEERTKNKGTQGYLKVSGPRLGTLGLS